jgi:hypothetical protein
MSEDVPIFDPSSDNDRQGHPALCPVKCNFTSNIPPLSDFFDSLPHFESTASKPGVKSTVDPSSVLEDLSGRISSLSNRLETDFYSIMNRHPGSPNIVTLPHNCGSDHERLSVLQPFAWKLSGPGTYYDPSEDRLMRNCIGFWDGASGTLRSHLVRLITQPCFLGYHALVIVSILTSIIVAVVPPTEIIKQHPHLRLWSCILIPLLAAVYDAAAVTFVIVADVYFSEGSDPRVADAVQAEVAGAVREALRDVAGGIDDPPRTADRIIAEFYPIAFNACRAGLRAYQKPPATLSWKTMEAFLIVFRFVRVIGEAAHLGSLTDVAEVAVLTPAEISDAARVVVGGIVSGGSEVHIQLLRLLYKGFCSAAVRERLLMENRNDLAINHFLGSHAMVMDIPGKCKTQLKSASPQRQANVEFATTPWEGDVDA